MEKFRREELLQEIEREEKLCREIYEEILKNRIMYEERIRKLQESKLVHAFDSFNLPESKGRLRTIPSSPKPRNLHFDDKENVFPLKNCSISPLNGKANRRLGLKIPLGSLNETFTAEGISSRKNPLDSLRNTTDRDELLLSIDSLQYSEDLSFL